MDPPPPWAPGVTPRIPFSGKKEGVGRGGYPPLGPPGVFRDSIYRKKGKCAPVAYRVCAVGDRRRDPFKKKIEIEKGQ